MITIVGLGAIGSIYAVALQKAGCKVRVAVDPKRVIEYSNNNLVFNNIEYKFDYFTPTSSDQKSDLIIIATKSTALNDAIELIKPIVGENTIIMSLLNGITSEEIVARNFGLQSILHSYFIGHTSTRVGRHIEQDGQYRTVFGEKLNDMNNLSQKVLLVKNIFDKANIKYRIDEDMISSLWQKFVINIGLNQVTGLLNKNYGEIEQDTEAQQLMTNLMKEAQNVAVALKIQNSQNFAQIGIDTLNKMEGSDSSSMLQDVIAGRPTEVDIFAGEVCRLGEKLGIETPLNKMVTERLK